LEDIRRNASAASSQKKAYLDRLTELRTDKQKKETERYKRELKSADKRIGQLDTTIAKLFESSALGRISEERCQSMLQVYEMEQQELKQRRIALAEAIEQAEMAYSNVENFVELIRRFTDIQELDTHILNSLIDRIVVHEKETLADGGKSQRVDIHYKFIGYMPLGEILMGANSINGIAVEEILVPWEQGSTRGGEMASPVVY
jgi:DNA repair exonuclease SbcCD ATPase subunit